MTVTGVCNTPLRHPETTNQFAPKLVCIRCRMETMKHVRPSHSYTYNRCGNSCTRSCEPFPKDLSWSPKVQKVKASTLDTLLIWGWKPDLPCLSPSTNHHILRSGDPTAMAGPRIVGRSGSRSWCHWPCQMLVLTTLVNYIDEFPCWNRAPG